MNQKNYLSTKSDAIQTLPKALAAGLIFKPVPKTEFIDGVHSQWPKTKVVKSNKKEENPSTAARGDDGLMSTPSIQTKS